MEPLIASILVAAAALSRLLPHPPNFAPVAAAALFAGAVLPRRWSLVVPFGAMLLSDALIGFYQLPVMLSVYSSFLLVVLLGSWAARQKKRAESVVLASLSGSVIFFLVTNFAVWAWGGLYPRTAAGLLASYTMAVPFFRNTLAGDLFYTAVIFGFYAALTWTIKNAGWLRDRQFLKNPRI